MSLADRLSGVLVVCFACHAPEPALSPRAPFAPSPPAVTTNTPLGALTAVALDPTNLVSIEMWGYTRELVAIDGTPIYCNSCHQGRLRFLDRSDPDALPRWMLVNYVRKLRHRDGSRVECFNCHGRPFEPRIIEMLRRRAPT